MTALPMSEIQMRLDQAFKLHPESKTLGDFRADKQLISAESEALRHAKKTISPVTTADRSSSGPGRKSDKKNRRYVTGGGSFFPLRPSAERAVMSCARLFVIWKCR